jgi:PAS domain S-box-containing protein
MSRTAPILSLLAGNSPLSELLPRLHERALAATGASCSVLFEHNPRSGVLNATSGFGLDRLPTEPWTPGSDEQALVDGVFAAGVPMLLEAASHQAPDLAACLGTGAALLVPLGGPIGRIGLLAAGLDRKPIQGPSSPALHDVADAFRTTLELFRLRRNEQLQRDIRALLDELAATLSSSLHLPSGLDVFCRGAKGLFGADRTAVWLVDRRARRLELKASSDPEHLAQGGRVAADDVTVPAATALQLPRASLVPGADESHPGGVVVPLRGRRRILGTIVFDGVRVEARGELDLLDRADELGRQLSSAIENVQLLEDVMRSRRELENAFDSIAHLVVVSDRQGRIVHANKAFADRLQLRREDVINRVVAECVGPELAGWLAARAASDRPDAQPDTCEVVDPVLAGPFMVTVTDLVNQDKAAVGHVLVARDMTPENQLEAEREQLRRRLTQSEKLAALGQFVAGIAHELNNPLQGVLGHLELLRTTEAVPKPLRPEFRTIYREADRAAKIVRNLLVFAGSRPIARRAVSLNAVLQKVCALRQPALRAQDIELVRHYDERLPRLQGDPLLLHQVFLNIVMNAEQAIAATGRGGRIEIATGPSAAGDGVVATVRDTGSGIPPEALSRIFEPFYTTKDVGKGTGLGLAIVYGIVQEHGGHISATNDAEGGAIFTVELPAPATRARGKRA